MRKFHKQHHVQEQYLGITLMEDVQDFHIIERHTMFII